MRSLIEKLNDYYPCADFDLQYTGGGCTAIVRDFGDGGHLMFTDANGMAPDGLGERDCLVCFYWADGSQWIEVCSGNGKYCAEIMAGFTSPIPKRSPVMSKRDALAKGLDAFWEAIAEHCYPEIKHGDLTPDSQDKIWAGAECALSEWLDNNLDQSKYELPS